MSLHYTDSSILHQLDQCAEEHTFPMLDNGYIYPVDSRLTAYRDNSRWVIVIETFGFSPRGGGHNGIDNCLYIFGNCLQCEPGINNENFIHPTDDSSEGETFGPEEEWLLNSGVSTMLLRGKTIKVPHEPAYYQSKGIDLEEPPRVTIWEFLRGIYEDHKEEFLATEEEIRQRIPKDLPLFLKLNEWFHPDLVTGERPSHTETFRMIAKALETGNAAFYNPTMEPNNHWKNWPEGGTL